MFMIIGLLVVLLLVLVLPFLFKQVEHNLEVFLFVMGLAAAIISGELTGELAIKALEEPIMISSAVLIAGILFKVLQKRVQSGIRAVLQVIPVQAFMLGVVVVLGLVSSVITAIIASLVLVEIVNALPVSRKTKVNLDIIACFSIGMGAALTPIGEPLSTIAISKLNQDFGYLLRLLGLYIVPGILGLGVFAAVFLRGAAKELALQREAAAAAEPEIEGRIIGGEVLADDVIHEGEETYKGVIIRALKVYLFVMALVFLGEGFRPFIDMFVIGLDNRLLYWINTVSAVLDNATLTAAEISTKMSDMQVRSILLGLLISGGILIPGNIPNIVSASKLKIGSREWAALGVPLGLVLLIVYFVLVVI